MAVVPSIGRREMAHAIPRRAMYAIASAGSVYSAFDIARRIMGPAAPTWSDIGHIYRYARKAIFGTPGKPISGSASVTSSSRKYPYQRGKKKTLKKQVKELKRIAEADRGTLVYRVRDATDVIAAVNQQSYSSHAVGSTTQFEAVLAQLKYYDPTTPGTLLTADGASGTYSKEFLFDTLYAKACARNNYQVPARVTMYILKLKTDTSITPSNAYSDGLVDVGNPTASSPLVFVSDSQQFNDLYSIFKTKSRILQPGQEMCISHGEKAIMYDPSFVDAHSHTTQKRYKAFYIFIRVEGVIGHDTTADEQGMLGAGIDYYVDKKFVVKYQAGADIHTIYIDDNASGFTNSGVVSAKPVSDNLSYSKA